MLTPNHEPTVEPTFANMWGEVGSLRAHRRGATPDSTRRILTTFKGIPHMCKSRSGDFMVKHMFSGKL